MEKDGSEKLMRGEDRGLRTVLKVQLSPGNNRKILMSFQVDDKNED